jgi:hypothetical protein
MIIAAAAAMMVAKMASPGLRRTRARAPLRGGALGALAADVAVICSRIRVVL